MERFLTPILDNFDSINELKIDFLRQNGMDVGLAAKMTNKNYPIDVQNKIK